MGDQQAEVTVYNLYFSSKPNENKKEILVIQFTNDLFEDKVKARCRLQQRQRAEWQPHPLWPALPAEGIPACRHIKI